MRFWPYAFVIVGVLIAFRWLMRRETAAQRHEAWRVDFERRRYGSGIEQRCIDWPIRKIVNEQANFNRHRLRKRA